ncbi:hypothetical protein [Aureimonas ureilytica]|uniref:hypothetical protein n=1 Tax=Aureimonas ureilytica TaxID=401562 RepID=UPI00037C8966|nr:hypothetical protein [Aureimonas ureilytica]
MMRFQIGLVALAMMVAVGPVEAAAPFVGKWSGGPASCQSPFRFTEKTYTPPGGKTLKIVRIERDGNSYLVSFSDGYRVALFDVSTRALTWHSPISGDTFELKRCR